MYVTLTCTYVCVNNYNAQLLILAVFLYILLNQFIVFNGILSKINLIDHLV